MTIKYDVHGIRGKISLRKSQSGYALTLNILGHRLLHMKLVLADSIQTEILQSIPNWII